jgi:hypothetical protein
MTKISDAEMHRRLDDLATNPGRALTPWHYSKTIEALVNLLDAKRCYDEKPGFWRKQKVEWHFANVKPGVERLAFAYELSFGPLPSFEQFFDLLKMRAEALSSARSYRS